MVAEPSPRIRGGRFPAAGWWRRRSLRFRLTATASAILALALALSAYVFVGVLSKALAQTIDDEVYQHAREVVALADAGRLGDQIVTTDNTIVQVLDASGRIVNATPGTDRLVPLLGERQREAAIRSGLPRFLDGRPYGIPGPLRVRALSADEGRTVIAARSFKEVQGSLETTGHVLIVGTPLLLILLAAASWLIIGRTLRPIALLRRGAAEISGTARARRLPVPEARDEVHSLATTLNDMLARLEAAGARQRALISDASHELRSPLASIRLQLEVALSHPEGQDWRETAEGVLEDTMRLSRLAEDLLALARLDEGRTAGREPVDLAELAGRTVERHGVTGDLTPGVTVYGDALDLGRVLTNLVANAVRHATSTVVVGLRTEFGGTGSGSTGSGSTGSGSTGSGSTGFGGAGSSAGGGAGGDTAVLTVTDDGPGIPEEDRERVFDRFTRLDSARSRDDGGAGLGLAIVRETVRAHGGSVHLEDAAPGLRAVVRLPLATSHESR
ncbi:ATP-binding protein [Microtetraspora sp. NBRC 16547]|uniref:sensor histidine kinase n=1 Tax=Microtetraspora sp. NBRC 16547 TaxID=3030993 RepID=UPI0024A5109E|nr:ATP-binding protein [Microtetraspora sp. NBRC 16547]GLX01713.1 two-component sensor histidine kinase [Microtetraspora sp. NBRC 16547]